ncbi:hypothetical protein GOARA_053_00490 [Gordonia araii NBRC 100433]|uniref:Uncharacterized protein n=1 Tax=Gordonia araii NBRC 100433 TaxID=1073574 RepID=G7H2Z7_9ACTN|nr:hypothetical protein GOARA_053_00490 [Gordonia araii NBRC 100433]
MKVDLAMVRGMAGRYEALSAAVAALDTTKDTQNMPTELPETDTGRFAQVVGKRVDQAFDATGNRITRMAKACRAARTTMTTPTWRAQRNCGPRASCDLHGLKCSPNEPACIVDGRQQLAGRQ